MVDGRLGNPADFAEMLVGVPHRVGGRSGDGVDAAGLIFLAFDVAGRDAPRFADLQAQSLGMTIDDPASLVRGDVIVFEHHVAILADSETVIHSVAGSGVVSEPLATILNEDRFGPVVARRRP